MKIHEISSSLAARLHPLALGFAVMVSLSGCVDGMIGDGLRSESEATLLVNYIDVVYQSGDFIEVERGDELELSATVRSVLRGYWGRYATARLILTDDRGVRIEAIRWPWSFLWTGHTYPIRGTWLADAEPGRYRVSIELITDQEQNGWVSSGPVGIVQVVDASGPAADSGVPEGGVPDTGFADTNALDAGVVDSGRPDSGVLSFDSDVLSPDSGVLSTSVPDSGRVDSGVPDSGRSDSGVRDSGRVDSGVPDSGRFDSGVPDSGRADSGIPDSGRRDSGPVFSPDSGRVSSRPPRPTGTVSLYYVGHSLTSDIPDFVTEFANQADSDAAWFAEQFVPGAALSWHWDETGPDGRGPTGTGDFEHQIHDAFASGRYSDIVITDSVPRGGQGMEDETVFYLGDMLRAIRRARPDARVYYYETWHHTTSGLPGHDPLNEDQVSPTRHLLWRERLDADGSMWERIVARVNAEVPPGVNGHPVLLIPAGRILGRVLDAMRAGQVPGFDSLDDLFSDEIHINHYAKMIVGAIHTEVLFARDARSLDIDVVNRHGGPYWDNETWDGFIYPRPDDSAVRVMLRIVHDEVDAFYR